MKWTWATITSKQFSRFATNSAVVFIWSHVNTVLALAKVLLVVENYQISCELRCRSAGGPSRHQSLSTYGTLCGERPTLDRLSPHSLARERENLMCRYAEICSSLIQNPLMPPPVLVRLVPFMLRTLLWSTHVRFREAGGFLITYRTCWLPLSDTRPYTFVCEDVVVHAAWQQSFWKRGRAYRILDLSSTSTLSRLAREERGTWDSRH